jgi:hypothetical protein
MNHFLKKVVFLFILISSVALYAQDYSLNEKQKKLFQPKFSLGSGIYNLIGDTPNEEAGFIKGRAGFNAGMKFNIFTNVDLSFLFITTSFSENINADGLGLQLTNSFEFKQSMFSPILSLGIQRFNVRNDAESSIALVVPIGFGLRMNLTERLQFDIAINFGMGMSDIDMVDENLANSDGYSSLNLTIHYDLFTANKNTEMEYFDDSYYSDVDFAKLESEDEDGDLVLDMDDYCPKTPIGVKVDVNGCPLDDDKDGIANYLDQQKNSPKGSVVDEDGVLLTIDKYRDMYSDFEISTRKYANFYNEVEIKRENYKTIDEYLIAKANAFNKAFNESLNDNAIVNALIYKVKIGEFSDGVPAKIANKLLSLDDLESFIMVDDAVIYSVGSYATLEKALSRMFAVEEKGFDNTCIIVDNNGEISNYIEPVLEIKKVEKEVVVDITENEANTNQEPNTNDVIVEGIVMEIKEPTNETKYRVQIGVYKNPIKVEVFDKVDDVVYYTSNDGNLIYMAGSFTDYKDAIDYQVQMRARGFDDAFIVTYKNGERISLNVAIKNNYNNFEVKNEDSDDSFDLKFTVQIMVAEVSVSADDLRKMTKLDNVNKQSKGSDMYEYYAGVYSNLEEANIQLEKAKQVGFYDSFIFATMRGERITLKQAKELFKE